MVSRVQRGAVAEWFWTIDRVFLAAFVLLLGIGFMLSFSASPPEAARLGLPSFFFVKRHAAFLLPTLVVLVGCSFLSPRHVRRAALRHTGAVDRLHGAGAVLRRRGQGFEALGFAARAVDPAFRVHEACLHRHLRLAVLRARAAPGSAGQPVCDHPVRHRCGAARRRARFRPDDADRDDLGRHVLPRRHFVVLDPDAAGAGGGRLRWRPTARSPTCSSASTGS